MACFLLLLFTLYPNILLVSHGKVLKIHEDVGLEINSYLTFMQKYGYLPEYGDSNNNFALTPASLSNAVKTLQKYAGLSQTGIIDEETKLLFKKKRCGRKDIDGASLRLKRYVLQTGWKKQNLTFRVYNGTRGLPKSRISNIMKRSFNLWAPYGNLKFKELKSGPADIEILFTKGDHGDGSPFDGPGYVVAHAFMPPHGSIHFDDDETWSEQTSDFSNDETSDFTDVTDFPTVALHEIGHALGLGHSDQKSSIMFPYYNASSMELNTDDIMAMHELYFGSSQSTESTDFLIANPTANKGINTKPDICQADYDTIAVFQGMVFVFKDEWLWIYHQFAKIDSWYPVQVHSYFAGLPKNIKKIDAAYERANHDILLFSGREYWIFNDNFTLKSTQDLSDYCIPEDYNEIHAIFLSNYNNKTYLFHYGRYWRFDETTITMDEGFPRSISFWRGYNKNSVKSVIVWRKDTFFFDGPNFWRFDNEKIMMHEHYPLSTQRIWFNCINATIV